MSTPDIPQPDDPSAAGAEHPGSGGSGNLTDGQLKMAAIAIAVVCAVRLAELLREEPDHPAAWVFAWVEGFVRPSARKLVETLGDRLDAAGVQAVLEGILETLLGAIVGKVAVDHAQVLADMRRVIQDVAEQN